MNASKMMPLLISAALAAAFSSARAADVGDADSLFVATQLTRAEVIADTQIWRESGLAAIQAGDSHDPTSREYLMAQQRYERMRASPQFAALVEQIARERGEVVRAAKR